MRLIACVHVFFSENRFRGLCLGNQEVDGFRKQGAFKEHYPRPFFGFEILVKLILTHAFVHVF